MIYTVTIKINNTVIEKDYEFDYALDAVNTAIDDNFDILTNQKSGFSLTCKVIGE